MAETLDVLIQVAERKVEAMQQALAKTRDALVELAKGMKKLEQDAAVAFVQAVAEDDVLALQAAGAFQERARRDIAALKELEAGLQTQESEQKVQLQELYAVQKKYELLLEKQKLAKRKERMKKAQNQLDEVAGRRKS
jgi:flagellar export protein FliJ